MHRSAPVVFEWLGAGDRIGLHGREGEHAQNEEDWTALFDFSDCYFFGKKTDPEFDKWTYPDAELPFEWNGLGDDDWKWFVDFADRLLRERRLRSQCEVLVVCFLRVS